MAQDPIIVAHVYEPIHMNMRAKQQLTLSVLPRCLKANKDAKKRILDEYCRRGFKGEE